MFSTPKKVFAKLCAHPYLSPLFGLAETPTVAPVSSPGGHSVPPSSSINSRFLTPPPRKRYNPYRSSPPNLRPLRPVGRGCHRGGIQKFSSRSSLRMGRSIRNLGKAKAARDAKFDLLSRSAFDTAKQTRTRLTREDRIFLKQFAKLGNDREITTGLAEARAAVDRAAELAPLINEEREAKAQAALEREKERKQTFASQRKAEAAAERERLAKAKLQAEDLVMRRQRLEELRKLRAREEALYRKKQAEFTARQQFKLFFQEAREREELRQQAERDRLAQEQEARRRNEEQAFIDAAARHEEDLRQQAERDRLAQEQEARRNEEQACIDAAARHEEDLRQQAERDRLAQEQEARCRDEKQAFVDATLRFQQEVQNRLQREKAARLQVEQEARHWFEAAQQAEMAANYASAQCNSRGFDGIDVSMMDASVPTTMDASMRTTMDASMRTTMDTSMWLDMDASMRTAAPYSPPHSSPPPPPPLTVADRFALYEHKWMALKSDVPVLCFELLPWPILHDVSTPEDITEERMLEFFYNPERPGYEQKSQRERTRIELLRWHPDKFLGKVLGKVDAECRPMVEEAMGQVTRFLVAYATS